MSVKKIFMTLIVIVMCIILGAFLINTLLPNVTRQVVNSAENSIYKATGMTFDFNNDSVKGSNKLDQSSDVEGAYDDHVKTDNVDGFK